MAQQGHSHLVLFPRRDVGGGTGRRIHPPPVCLSLCLATLARCRHISETIMPYPLYAVKNNPSVCEHPLTMLQEEWLQQPATQIGSAVGRIGV